MNNIFMQTADHRLVKIPEKPGIYIFRDSEGRALYVGKAKVLKNRVRSYFQKTSALDDRKTAMMKLVSDIEFTVTGNELEALILEANLIRQHKPRYNILLRDDKSYPYLKLTVNERWPRLEVVRRVQKDGARYFGPYVPAGAMWDTLSFIRRHYRIPNCRYSLEKRMRPCIQFQIGKCIGPCSGDVDHDEYLQMISEVALLLEGKNRKLLESLRQKMLNLSDDMKYEEAAVIRDRIRALLSVSESQKIASPDLGDLDIIGMFRQRDAVVFKLLFVRGGVIIGARDFLQRHTEKEKDSYLCRNFMEQFYGRELMPPPEICSSKMPEDAGALAEWLSDRRGGRVRVHAPSRGIKRKLVRMAEENSEEIMKIRLSETPVDIANEIASLLGLSKHPGTIGAFDISNIRGTSAVGAFIVWRDGSFDKSMYRNVSMDSVRGPDDYEMMREMIRRTMKSFKESYQQSVISNQSSVISNQLSVRSRQHSVIMPDLIIIDGGREHLNAALGVFKELHIAAPTVVGLAKDPDRVFLDGRSEPLLISDSRPASLLLRKIRDEVHRFAISCHRKARSKKTFESALDSIYGLGRQRRYALVERFGSIDSIKKASVSEIAGLKGFTAKMAEYVLRVLNEEKAAGQ